MSSIGGDRQMPAVNTRAATRNRVSAENPADSVGFRRKLTRSCAFPVTPAAAADLRGRHHVGALRCVRRSAEEMPMSNADLA